MGLRLVVALNENFFWDGCIKDSHMRVLDALIYLKVKNAWLVLMRFMPRP